MSAAAQTQLEEELSEPTAETVAAMTRVTGDIVVLGAAGKMGPSLVRLAIRASADASVSRRVYAVSRFADPGARAILEASGAVVIACDLFDAAAVAALPDAPNVMYMAGRKFGTTGDEPGTWATNAWLPGAIARCYAGARVVAFSTGNVYPLTPTASPGPGEDTAPAPVGEYAQSALARERVLEFFSRRDRTPMAILRLNYAIEPRYGVLRDIADKVRAGLPIDLTMGWVNVIWQRDANAIALRALEHCATPPLVLNLAGAPAVRVRDLALAFARAFGVTAHFSNAESDTALLSDAARCHRIFGAPQTSVAEMVDRIATWILAGGGTLARPTHFEERGGRF
jgi:nucleoside-diphosphate-sugar epimerase